MNRREFIGVSLAPLLAARAVGSRPNIVLIVADDLGYGDLGCYGQRQIATPNLDRLAAEGTRFTQAYSGSTVCAPSRCCLMTGKHTGHATVRGNLRPEVGLRQGEPTVASLLQRADYRTTLFGKWGLGGPGTRSVPNSRGFDEFFGYLDQLHAHNYYPEHLWENENEFFLTENWFDRRKQYAPDLFTARALDFVGRRHRSPFFLYLTSTIPHANNELAAYAGNGMEVPGDQPYTDRPWPQTEKNFAAMLARMDRDVGKLMEAIKVAGSDENTLVLFTSDNGPHKEGGHNPDFFGSRGPLRGIKRDLYEGGIRVPLLARWPGKVPAGKISDQVLAFWDFLPTACETADVSPPGNLDGISMLAPLLGRGGVEHPPLYWEFHEGRFAQAVRSKDWKAVRNDAGRPVELYNLTDDPGERNDLAAKYPEIVTQLASRMETCRVDSPLFPVRAISGEGHPGPFRTAG